MQKYRQAITTEMNWLICEGPEKLRVLMLRAPFSTMQLEQLLNYSLISNMNHAVGLYKLCQKNNPMLSSFAVQLITNTRGILYGFLFHAVNAIGKCLANILDVDNLKVYDWDYTALRRVRVRVHVRVETIYYIIFIDQLPPD